MTFHITLNAYRILQRVKESVLTFVVLLTEKSHIIVNDD